MSNSKKIFTGILAFLPALLLCIYLGLIMIFFVRMFPQLDNRESELVFADVIWVFVIGIIMAIFSLIAFVYFLIHSIKQPSDSTERLAWILIIIFANIIAYPIYWYMRIWKTIPRPTVPKS